jgi:hypothetical protein
VTTARIRVAFLVAACSTAVGAGTSAFAVPRTQTLEDDKTRIFAKVANERAKANTTRSRGMSEEDERRCGSVDIGNVDTGGSRRTPREVTTVVLGDVINAPGRCK